MGALALATEDPTPDLLNQKPNGRDEPLINRKMWKHISIQALYQLGWLFACLYALPKINIARWVLCRTILAVDRRSICITAKQLIQNVHCVVSMVPIISCQCRHVKHV